MSLTAHQDRRSGVRWPVVTAALLVVAAIVYCCVALVGSPGELHPVSAHRVLVMKTKPARLPWPNYGQGAFGVAGGTDGAGGTGGTVLATHGAQTPVPTASVAKLITVLCILTKKPIAPTADGPTITLRQSDVALYNKYVAEDGSVVPVRAGQRITERAALEAILLPSANNVADSLAIWAFGSLADYRTYATAFLHRHGMRHTHIGSDASGFQPDTTSTAADLVKLGDLAMGNPVVRPIVAEQSVTIPDSGTFYNVDSLLGEDGIIGIKTGNSDQDGGVFVGAVPARTAGRSTTVVTALAGAPSLDVVLTDSHALLAAASQSVVRVTVARAGEVLGQYRPPGGDPVDAIASHAVTTTVVRGTTVRATVRLRPIGYGVKAGVAVGTVTVAGAPAVPVVLKQAPSKPGIGYRLLHP